MNDYSKYWLVFAHIKPAKGYSFNELVESETSENYIGAWANLIIKADTINGALDIVPLGLKEKNFDVEFIDKIENIQSLYEYNELDEIVINEVEWISKTNFVFLISDKVFPYTSEE